MKKIIVDKNENEQRIDRFLKKYLDKASTNFIYKIMRKKYIKINGKKADPEAMIYTGDVIEIYLADETIEKFRSEVKITKKTSRLDIVYEDDNIIIINKPQGILSHSISKAYEPNIVDFMINYLIETGSYVPRVELTFKPAICNRLDRNTSGLVIGAKNYNTLKGVNEAIRDFRIEKYYYTVVKGDFAEELDKKAYLSKDEFRNVSSIEDVEFKGAKEIHTVFKPVIRNNGYTLIEVRIITGRTHQIRSQLNSLGYSIIGDDKYGNGLINKNLRDKYSLRGQWLHCGKLVFGEFHDELNYLTGMEFKSKPSQKNVNIAKELLGGFYE